jgi:hypothetical protein
MSAEWNKRIKQETVDAYGGKCVCCGEGTFEFLSIDHVNGGGDHHRREVGGGGVVLYQWLRKRNFPQDGRFQVLCFNCNMAKGFYGACPHEVVRTAGIVG